MPVYNSIGISASLLVTDLDETLSDGIIFRMGGKQKKDAARIETQLSQGRVLQERPIGADDSQVGILQLVGDDQDMALVTVEATDGQYEGGGYVAYERADQGGSLVEANLELNSADDAMMSVPPPTNVLFGKESNTGRKSKNNDTHKVSINTANGQNDLSRGQKRQESLAHDSPKELAICLQVGCAEFWKRDRKDLGLLGGKDLKLEVFINGQLVDVAYESSRAGRRSGTIRFHGTRIHRQAEKPWIYEPHASASDGASNQRWDRIGKALEQEASMRGTDKFNQRPLTAQFLTTLAQSRLPASVKAKGHHFAIVDLIITAGTGRKFDADTAYITETTRLLDSKFSSAPIVEPRELTHDEEEDIMFQDYVHMSDDEHTDLPRGLSSSPINDIAKQLHAPTTPQTPTPKRKGQHHLGTSGATLMRQTISKYQNASGQLKGKRTLKQRLGDMSKMSPTKQVEALDSLKTELDDETMNAVMLEYNVKPSVVKTPTPNEVQCSENLMEIAVANHGGPDLSTVLTTPDALSRSLPPVNPFWLEEEAFEPKLQPYTAMSTNNDTGIVCNDHLVASTQVQWPPLEPLEEEFQKTAASASARSPFSSPVKYGTPRREGKVDPQPVDPSLHEQPNLRLPVSTAVLPRTPQCSIKRGRSGEQTSEEALENFSVPDIFKGSAITYADGLKQRQMTKARGGEFEEQQFVVGMRFIVL